MGESGGLGGRGVGGRGDVLGKEECGPGLQERVLARGVSFKFSQLFMQLWVSVTGVFCQDNILLRGAYFFFIEL